MTGRRPHWRNGLLTAALALTIPLALYACSDSDDGDDDDDNSSSGSGGNGASCPDMSGNWTITQHCDPQQVGTTVVISQTGCDFTNDTFGFSGTLTADGTMTSTGTVNGETINCTGQATGTTFTNDCTPSDCHVEGEKQ